MMNIYTSVTVASGKKYVEANTPGEHGVSTKVRQDLNPCQNAARAASLLRDCLGWTGGRWMPSQTGTDRYTFRDEDAA